LLAIPIDRYPNFLDLERAECLPTKNYSPRWVPRNGFYY